MPGTGTCPFGLGEAEARELRPEPGRVGARVGRRLGDGVQDLRLDGARPRRLLERGGVLLGDVLEVVLGADVGERGLAHARGDAGLGEPPHRRGQRLDLSLADRHLQRDVVGQLREPADVADDERLAERERADRAARRLAHRRRAQEDARIARRHQAPEALLLDVRLADHALVVEAEPLEPPVEVEAGRLGADEQQARSRMPGTEVRERAQHLRDALALVQVAEAAEERLAVDLRRLELGCGPRGMGDAPERPVVAVLAHECLDIARVDDHARGAVEHLAGERELGRPDLPERRHAALEDAPAEHAPGDARLALDRGEVRVPVMPPDRHARDEVMDDEVVQHDDAGPSAQRIDDPRVRIGIVADVIERDVGIRDRTRTPGPHHLDLDESLERRQQQRRVVGDAARARRQRREVRDLHATAASSRSMHESHVTARAISRPARPSVRASSALSRSQTHASRESLDVRRDDEPRLAIARRCRAARPRRSSSRRASRRGTPRTGRGRSPR